MSDLTDAYRAWVDNDAFLERGHYYLHANRRKRAPWDATVQKVYGGDAGNGEFHAAAEEWARRTGHETHAQRRHALFLRLNPTARRNEP